MIIKDEEAPFNQSQSLNTMLTTQSCQKESRQSPDCIIEPLMTKPQTTFLNRKTQNSSFEVRYSVSNSERPNDKSKESVTEASKARVPISLPAHCSKLNSIAMLRDELKRKSASNPVLYDRKLAVDSQLIGLQKIKAKMMSSSRLSAQSIDTENVKKDFDKLEITENLRRARWLDNRWQRTVGQRI